MHLIKALSIIVIFVAQGHNTIEHQNAYIDDWDSETDWTSHFAPCRTHFMFKFSPCEPKTKMLACCRRFNPFLLFVFAIISLIIIIAVPILLLCCICAPFRVLCECFLCSACCAIDENGNFIHFADDDERATEELDIKTEEYTTTTTSRMDSIAKTVVGI